jgi:protein-disulfide isomerase-like protein with CxxC motif
VQGSAVRRPAIGGTTTPHGHERATLTGTRLSVTYVTDPICSACWAMEPAWRAIEFRYGDLLDVRQVYGGLLPRWEGFADAANGIAGPEDVAEHWEVLARRTGQPLTADVWRTDPIASSFPPSIVAAAVRVAAPEREAVFLRLLREELFVHGRNIARPDVWSRAVRAAGVDESVVLGHLTGAAYDTFVEDLATARRLRISAFPTVIVESADARLVLRGVQSFARLEAAVVGAAGVRARRQRVSLTEAIAVLGTGTTAEYAAVLGAERVDVEAALATSGLRPITLTGGAAWTA